MAFISIFFYLIKPINWQEFQDRITALNLFWSDHVEKPVIF